MDNSATIDDLKEKVRIFCEERDWDQYHGPKDLSIVIITEAAELLEHFRFKSEAESEKMLRDQGKRNEACEEIADIMIGVLRLAQRYDIDLSEELVKKIEKARMKYPVEKSRGSNKKYNEL